MLWAAFRNYYSRKRDALFTTPEAVFANCVQWTREYHPTLWPEIGA
jgi:hypothetical protein